MKIHKNKFPANNLFYTVTACLGAVQFKSDSFAVLSIPRFIHIILCIVYTLNALGLYLVCLHLVWITTNERALKCLTLCSDCYCKPVHVVYLAMTCVT